MPIDYQAILDTYRQLHQRANQANEQRYQDILQNVGATTERVGSSYDQMHGLLEGLGTSDMARIGQQQTQARGQADQDLISRGLGNTTIRQSVHRGIDEDAERSRGEVTERVGAQRAAALQGQAGAEERMGNFLSQMMEARTDQGPDLGMFAQLMQQAGMAQGAGAGEHQTISIGPSQGGGFGGGASGGGASGGGGRGPGTPGAGPVHPAGANTVQVRRPGGASAIRGATQQAAGQLGSTGFGSAGGGTATMGGGGGGGPASLDLMGAGGELDTSGLGDFLAQHRPGGPGGQQDQQTPEPAGAQQAGGGQQPAGGGGPGPSRSQRQVMGMRGFTWDAERGQWAPM